MSACFRLSTRTPCRQQRMNTGHISSSEHPAPSRPTNKSHMPSSSIPEEAHTQPEVLIPRPGGEGLRDSSDLRSTRRVLNSHHTSCADHPEQRNATCERMPARQAKHEFQATNMSIPCGEAGRRTCSRLSNERSVCRTQLLRLDSMSPECSDALAAYRTTTTGRLRLI